MVTASTAQEMTRMIFFAVQVIVGTHGVTQYSVNRQTNYILNITPSSFSLGSFLALILT